MPIDYKKYPKNWKQLRAAVLDRADHRCELCFTKNHADGWRRKDGAFCTGAPYQFYSRNKDIFRRTKIVLTLHHINHDISDNRLINLIALCQRCHLRLDRPWRTRVKKKKLQSQLISR